ncbi:NACHT, LRR and PYD domains-containing protein 3-like isoform X2 [Hypanus sabinus]|uniref:NACHT, LRR and PYD domains-containing protein 3-like isoform X2 n=1 Tax=Hypanus sabinus TaxID=79690 RepID=UPI0028C4F5D8|nr:NACHT, LRR and PYD domains-containing protein 3-like isoform X2 [Hypanus sabinus]
MQNWADQCHMEFKPDKCEVVNLDISRMTKSKHSFLLKFVLLMLLVGPVARPPTKPQPVDDEQEVDVTDPGEGAEVHNRELSLVFQTNVGQDSSNETYSHLRETVEAGDVNMDERYKGVSNIVGKTTGGSVSRRMIEDRMLTAPKNELDASERTEWSALAMAESPAMFDVEDRKKKHNRNRRREFASDNFGAGYGKKSDIVHSTSFRKEISGDSKTDKGRTLMLLDREGEASGAKKTAVEAQLWQYIGIPISFAIVLAACAWTRRCYERLQHKRHGDNSIERDNLLSNNDEEQHLTADRADQIRQILASITDLQLYRVTEKHHEQLETEIKDDVENIHQSLLREGYRRELNLEEIMLTGGNQGLAESRLLLKSILHGSIRECRMFWNKLTTTQVNLQYLITLLKQDVEEEAILQHRYNLRVQSRNMKMPKSGLISDIYTDPLITMTHPDQDDVTAKNNSQGREVAIHELLKRRNSDTEKSNISVVYGAAGSGKTTLIQKIIHDWAMGIIYEEFRFVLHFKVQNLNAIKGRTTLSRLIADTYPYLEDYQDDLWKEPKNLLFIFDDLNHLDRSISFSDDERNSDPRHRCTGPESICFVHDILRCLLQGELLKGCSVLITARIWENEALRHVTADSTFQVLGFTSEKVNEYFSHYLHNRQYMNEVVQLIEKNEILQNMSSNPLFCYVLASQPQREQSTMPIINNTKVLFDYFVLLLRACGYDDKTTLKCLLKVGELAYKGITLNTLSFEAGALSEQNFCPPEFISAFMIQDSDKANRGLYKFADSVVRDFLAALAKILNTPKAQLKGLLDDQFTDTTGRFRKFSLFLVGLSSQTSIDHLKFQLGLVCSEVTSCTSEWFRESVKRRLKNTEQRKVLHILYSLLEFGDNQVLEDVLAPTTTIKLNQLLLTSPDFTVLSRTLIHSELIEELDLSSCLAHPEEIQKLELLLHRCVILRLNHNKLQDSGVKDVFKTLEKTDCKIQTLELKSNHLTDDCLGALFSALRTNRSLTLLNLNNSHQDGQHDNQFTPERLKHHVDNYDNQQKEIRWQRDEHDVLDTTPNLLNLITD